MGKFDPYKIQLLTLPLGTHELSYQLDTEYFKKIDSPEVEKGLVQAKVVIKYSGDDYEIRYELEGSIFIPCDRCLDDMELPIKAKSKLIVKLGTEYAEEGDDIIIVPESEGFINLAWFLYESIALSIPIKHVHAPGKCNRAMTSKLQKHSARVVRDGNDGDEGGSDEDAGFVDGGDDFVDPMEDDSADVEMEKNTDPRWDALKNMIDNN